MLLTMLTGLLSSCDNSELQDKIAGLEKENTDLTALTDSLQTTMNDSIQYYKSTIDSLRTLMAKNEKDQIVKTKCSLAGNLTKTIEKFEKYYKGVVSPQLSYQVDYPDYDVVSKYYNNAIYNYKSSEPHLTTKQKEDIATMLQNINQQLSKKYYSGEDLMRIQLWLALAKRKCKDLKKSLCQ